MNKTNQRPSCHPERTYCAKGLCYKCYAAHKARERRERIKADPDLYEKYKAKNKIWNANARRSPEALAKAKQRGPEYQRAYRARHLEEVRRRSREHSQKVRTERGEELNANARERRAANKEKYLAYERASYWKHVDKRRAEARERARKFRHDAIRAYGGYLCVCCGETTKEFLCIDHIDGGGEKHRKTMGGNRICEWLKKNGYPPGFRVLCHNCNSALGYYGYCPHKSS